MSGFRIAVADDDPDMQRFYHATLSAMGHEVVLQASGGRQLVDACRRSHPDLVISDVRMPDMDGIEAVERIRAQDQLVPVILVSAFHDDELIARTSADHILAYLVKPIKPADLQAAIAIAMRRFAQFQELRQEANSLRQAIEDRKLIERAKGLIMKRSGIDEEAAHRRLQLVARQQSQKLVDIARMVLTIEGVYHPPNSESSTRTGPEIS